MIAHRPLRDREGILSSDVADAIEMLVGPPNARSLPVAFTKDKIVQQLVRIAHTDDEGIVHEPLRIVARSMTETFRNRLTNTAVFQTGYKRFEKRSDLPVVPVTDFFFRVVYADGDTAGALDGMTSMEIRQSLPKRLSRVADGDDYMRNANGEIAVFGELAGIIVYPANSMDALLRAWLERLVNKTAGSLRRTVGSIEHARPETVATARLKETAAPLGGAMRKALPKLRDRGDD